MTLRILVSLTAGDPSSLGDLAERMVDAGADGLHVDIADGSFVPTLTYGPTMVAGLRRRLPTAVLDVHLMVERPESHFEELAAAGASRVAFHAEAAPYPWRTLTLARRAGLASVGIALNPATPLGLLDSVGGEVSFVNLLTTEPDVSGERLRPSSPARIRAARERLPAGAIILVDGGVTPDNVSMLVAAGASEIVAGRAVTASPEPAAVIAALRAVAP